MMAEVLLETNLEGFERRSRGKVRDAFEVGDALLMVTTDRISAFDVVLPNGIPNKGKVLNLLSLFWFDRTRDLVANHVISGNAADFPPELAPFRDQLTARSMLVRKLVPVPFECVVRGYLYGSGWKEYQRTGAVCGIPLGAGMQLAEKFAEPIFTPATKEDTGHDINVSEAVMADALGSELTKRLRELSLAIYLRGRDEAEKRGILIADTKFEFGRDERGDLFLIDEVLTPDSSRFWPLDSYHPGQEQPSFDKQFVREYLETLDWDKTYPGPELPEDVVRGTSQRFLQAYETLTGHDGLE